MRVSLGVVRRLRWRLTLSYALVSIVTVLAVEAIFLILVQSWIGSADFAALIGNALDSVAPEAAPYLIQAPPDASGLQGWLVGRMRQTYLRLPFDVDVTEGSNAVLAVVDRDGRTLASANPDRAKPGDDLAMHLSVPAQSALRAALADDPDLAHRAIRASDGAIVVAAPIVVGGQTRGALVLVPDLVAMRRQFLARAAGAFFASAIALTLLFGALGTLFGYAWARWLTGRLRILTDAVEAWGRGDLDVVADDPSPDELGEHARQLNRMAEELRALLQARAALAAAEERQRLARDLHDAVKQEIFAVAMQLGAARTLWDRDPALARSYLGEAEQLARQAQGELTALIQELRPAALADKGLGAALGAWLRDWSRRTGVAVEEHLPGDRALPMEVEQAVFRVAQEALANVARHSAAQNVRVTLAFPDDALILTIEDDGHGFDIESARSKGIGLTSMRERIEAIGGTFHLESAAGGTRLDLRVQLNSEDMSAPSSRVANGSSNSERASLSGLKERL